MSISAIQSARFTRRRVLLSAGAASMAMALSQARAQHARATYKLIVPFAPGGGNDVFARQLAHGLTEQFGLTVVVENKPGAGGNLGTEFVVRAPAHGQTFLLGHTGTVSINPALYKNLKFNPTQDLRPVAMFASSALLLVVPASSPASTLPQLVDVLRSRRGRYNYASSGAGTGGHLTGEMFLHMLQAQATHIAYRGTAPSLNDLAAGLVDFSFSVIPAAQALVKAGKLRALAITSARRHQEMPDLPTVAEAGIAALAGFESTLTYGVLAPRAAPPAAMQALGEKILEVASTPAFQSKLGVEGAEPLLGDSAQYAQRIQQEADKWRAVVEASGASV